MGERCGNGSPLPFWSEARRRGDPLKIKLARELRKQTAMSMGWIAKELNAGAPNSIWNARRRLHDRGEGGKRE